MPPTQLTAREVEVRDLAAEGKTNEEIAGRLGLSGEGWLGAGVVSSGGRGGPARVVGPGRPPVGRRVSEQLSLDARGSALGGAAHFPISSSRCRAFRWYSSLFGVIEMTSLNLVAASSGSVCMLA